jgi:hypothetical protein
MLPPLAVDIVGHILPFFELFLGLRLASGVGLRFSSVLSTLAFCAIMTAIAWAYHKGLKIKCGCGIGLDEEVGPGALIRDGLRFLPLGLAVTFGAFWIRRKTCQTAAGRLAQKQTDGIGDEVRNRVDPQIAAPDVEQGEYGAGKTGNCHMAPAPNP